MRFVLLLIAAVIAVIAGVVALQWSSKNKTPAPVTTQVVGSEGPAVSTVDILVARDPISVGTVIDESMVDKQPWPEHLVLEGFIVAGSKDSNLVGKVARASFQAREPFTISKLANPNDPSFLAAQLGEGMRAVTMGTDTVSGVAGYVFPGDRVDVLLTHNVPQEIKAQEGSGSGSQRPAIAEVMIPNARVLAVNVREASGKQTPVTAPSSITLEVKDVDAERLRLAEKVGTLSLVLRSIKDKDTDTAPAPILLRSLTQIGVEKEDVSGIKVVRGAGEAAVTETRANMAPATMPATGPSGASATYR